MPEETSLRSGDDLFAPWLAGGAEPGARHGPDQSRPAVGREHHYIRLQEEFAFLAVVLDAFSRRVIGWALDTHLQASLAIGKLTIVPALGVAVAN